MEILTVIGINKGQMCYKKPVMLTWLSKNIDNFFKYPPVIEASTKVANLTERKNLHTPIYGVK